MAKTTFLSWSQTAASNTDIDGIGILGSNAVANFDNALRTLMAQLRRDVDGRVVYASKSGNYTAVADDNNAAHRYTAAATVTLTAAATLATNWHYTVIADGGAVTIDPNASETINGQTTFVIPNGSSATIICDGSNFFTVIKPFSWESIGYYTLSAAASLSITNLSAFRMLRISGSITPSAAAVGLFIRSSTNNGSSYDSGAADYTNQTLVGAGGSAAASNASDTALAITKQTLLAVSFETILLNFNASGSNMHATSRVYTNLSPSGVSSENNGGQRNSGAARNAFQIIPSGAVTLAGFVMVEGLRG
ncbi:hypothetical protein [Rhizobium leguminosarum]|uniref:hypothetical protein n=1 Tax=Rhizobium leguminosarum TaxID=384 RepID=UPI00103A9F59|nr:hypothetical protein [Rhizobium leguminosarum]TBZ00236.1 hypothetical protein E0H49_15900 [Rhizobium leguminosarum bv. viciae]